jgi:hypothetical protein
MRMTSNEVLKQRFELMMSKDFEPMRVMGSAAISNEARMVAAMEYSAYQLGKIRQLLEKSETK